MIGFSFQNQHSWIYTRDYDPHPSLTISHLTRVDHLEAPRSLAPGVVLVAHLDHIDAEGDARRRRRIPHVDPHSRVGLVPTSIECKPSNTTVIHTRVHSAIIETSCE